MMTLSQNELDELVAVARKVREHAYVPYSHFPVGAALRTEDGKVYAGCNVENASIGLTICAERSAVAQAVSHGDRRFQAVAVVTGNGVTPCGMCRQTLAEFGPDMAVIIEDLAGNRRQYTVRELLPDGFGPEHLAS